jgi:MinD-like ATPase involved in chromosome partitioning or flagellar assembly
VSLVAVIGDCTTTTSVALSATWPSGDEVVILEADRSGGSLTGWLDTPPTPSLSTIVAQVHSNAIGAAPATTWTAVDPMVRRSTAGIRFIAAPIRAREANRAINEASATILPMLASLAEPTVLADCGRHNPADPTPAAISLAHTIIVVHRQHDASALAASVRLERLAEMVHDLQPLDVPIHLAVIGNRPFDLDEIHRFVSHDSEHVHTHGLADDPLSAAVFAGRTGVTAKRLGRLPLMRSMHGATDAVRRSLGISGDDLGDRHGADTQTNTRHRDDDTTWLESLGTTT